MDVSERAKLHAALADPLRLRLVDHLMSKGEACGKELAAALGASVALVSHHTKILEDCGIIVRRREGQFSRFSLNRATLAALREEE
ncbi:MAG: metalloregulator ArsR/SmtB family transcription factor [Treponema sp.]|nr:metalloregulator ArsR/SmtB family transcription factor [Treponema sp.]